MGLGWIRKLSPSSQATIHHHSSPFLAQSVAHWACARVRYWMKLIECWTWALNRRSKRSCSMFQEVGTPCSSPPHGPGRPGNFLHGDGGFRWRHVALWCASWDAWDARLMETKEILNHTMRSTSFKPKKEWQKEIWHWNILKLLWLWRRHLSPLEEVRQLASTILYQPARVMIGNRDELKANQDQRGRDAVGIVCPLAIKAESGTSTTCIYTCPYFLGGGVYVLNTCLFKKYQMCYFPI